MNSDENFLIARKYGFLRSRVLLYRQDELSVLEKDLIALDEDDYENRPMALQSRKEDENNDPDPKSGRKMLMQKIDNKLKEYGKSHLPLSTPLSTPRLTQRRRINSQIPNFHFTKVTF